VAGAGNGDQLHNPPVQRLVPRAVMPSAWFLSNHLRKSNFSTGRPARLQLC